MARCAAIKANGERCKIDAIEDQEWCWSHHPDFEEERTRRASKAGRRGGRGRKQIEPNSIKTQLQSLADGVLDGSIVRADAAVASQMLNVRLRAVEIERRVRETEDLEARIEALEVKGATEA